MGPQWWMLGGCLVLGYILGAKHRQHQVENLKQILRYLIDRLGKLRDDLKDYEEELNYYRKEAAKPVNSHRVMDPSLGR